MVKDCLNKEILVDFLQKYGSEVLNMLYAEWNLDEYVAVQREESAIDALLKTAKNALGLGLSPEQAALISELPLEKVTALCAE